MNAVGASSKAMRLLSLEEQGVRHSDFLRNKPSPAKSSFVPVLRALRSSSQKGEACWMGIHRTNVPFDPRISLPIPRTTGYDSYP